MSKRSLILFGLLVWLGSNAPLCAQATTMSGTLVDPDGRPIPGAAVYVLDGAGAQVASVLSDDLGRFHVRLLSEGTYHLRVERIGFETQVVSDLAVPQFDENRAISLSFQPLELDPLEVTAERVCHAEANRNPRLVRIWLEVRKALAQTALASQDSSRSFEVETTERVLDPDLKPVRARTDTLSLTDSHAFAFQPIEQLGPMGWGEREDDGVTTLFGPSPDAFLSPRFGATHCLSLAREDGSTSLLGLRFESIPDSLTVGLQGTFWIEPDSWHLERIDFRYTGTPELERDKHQGGSVILRVDSEERWYVAAWSVVGPVMELHELGYTEIAMGVYRRQSRFRVVNYLEHAGRVLGGDEVPATATSPWATTEALVRAVPDPEARRSAVVANAVLAACPGSGSSSAVVAGTVADSVSAVALARARVEMAWKVDSEPPNRMTETETDNRGYYQFCDAPTGRPITLTASLHGASAWGGTTLTPGTLAIEHLKIPFSDPHEPGVLLGRVIDAETRRPVPNAVVTIEQEDTSRVLTNQRGYFSLGELPWGVYNLSVGALGYADRKAAVRIQGGVTQTAEIGMTQRPIPIEGLEVTARRRTTGGSMEAVLRRMRLGFGSVLTRESIERRPSAPVSELLREVPGVQVQVIGPDEVYLDVRGRTCVPDVFVDGVPWLADAKSALTLFRGAEIEAIEVYRGSLETPAEFMRTGVTPCAVVAVWTR